MTGNDFRTRCLAAGYTTVHSAARGLGVSARTVDRCRAGDIPRHVRRTLELLEQVAALRDELQRLRREERS